MSLLSRFRRTVVPMSTRKKPNTDDSRFYNYQKSTKSFNEKTVKSRNFPSCTDSHGDCTNTTDHQYQNLHHQQPHQQLNQNLKEKIATRNSFSKNVSKLSTHNINKSSKPKTDKALSENVNLSRSNTFTLEKEMNDQSKNQPHSRRKENTSNCTEYHAVAECDKRISK